MTDAWPVPDVLSLVHRHCRPQIHPGSLCIDATVGNGHDLLFLAGQVGETGHVYGFDLQAAAIATARERLREEGLMDRVTLFEVGHEHMASVLPDACTGNVSAITFNLGYLPGSDKTCVTRPATTLAALAQGCELLAPGGVMTVVGYPGHPGGTDEVEAVRAWGRGLSPRAFRCAVYETLNTGTPAPVLFVVGHRSA